MELSDRKRKILQTIIEEYIGTAEPVGSRVLSKRNDMGFSSATIRNEMADLEDMGYLVQPHTSAGRIPTDIGYRFYVDSLMQRYNISMEAIARMQQELENRVNQLDVLIKKASLITSALTNYTTVVSTPELNRTKIKKIDLILLGGQNVMLIVVTKTGIVRNRVMQIDIDERSVEKLSHILNERLCDLTGDEITFAMIEELQHEIKQRVQLDLKSLLEILNFVYETIGLLETTEVYVDNMQSILNYPEYKDVGKAREILNFLDDAENVRTLMRAPADGEDMQIVIGNENPFEQLRDCSLVTVNYSVKGHPIGKIGVIGPKRMNYAMVVSSLDCISKNINKILYELYMGDQDESE